MFVYNYVTKNLIDPPPPPPLPDPTMERAMKDVKELEKLMNEIENVGVDEKKCKKLLAEARKVWKDLKDNVLTNSPIASNPTLQHFKGEIENEVKNNLDNYLDAVLRDGAKKTDATLGQLLKELESLKP